MGCSGSDVAEARFVDIGAGAGDEPRRAGDEEVDSRDGDSGRRAGYAERGCAVQSAGYGEGGGQCGVRVDTCWVEGA